MLLTAKYVLPITDSFIEDGAVLVHGTDIVAVGTAKDLKAQYPDEEVRDFGLAALAPGFVDTHTHLRYTALRGMFEDMPYADWKRAVLRCEPFFDYKDWEDSSFLGALEAIASGITTVADITRPGNSVKAIHRSGLRGVIYREVGTMRPQNVDEAMDEAMADIDRWKGITADAADRMSYGLGAAPIYSTHPKMLAAIAAKSHETGMPVALHLAGSVEEAEFIRWGSGEFSVARSRIAEAGIDVSPWMPSGVSPVRYVYNWNILEVPQVLVVHAVQVDDDDIEILAHCPNVSISHCPRINAKLGMGAAPVNKLLEAGLTVGFGTDSPAAVDTTDMIDEMRVGLLLNRAFNGGKAEKLTSEKALRMATIDGARALGLDGMIGSLEPGKKADIIAIDLHNSHQNPITNPSSAITYTANQDNVMWTMVNGKVLYDNFVHVSGLDRNGIAERAREIRMRVRLGANDDELREQIIRRMDQDDSDRIKR